MPKTIFHDVFAHFKRYSPKPVSEVFRRVGTAFLTPFLFGWNTGHFLSSLLGRSVTKDGAALPWYNYPCIHFLQQRSFSDKTILEFGGGQSTTWWAQRALRVVTFESDQKWMEKIRSQNLDNVQLHLVSGDDPEECISDVTAVLNAAPNQRFDIIIIDGLFRRELIDIAIQFLETNGALICDNSEGYGFHEELKDKSFQRLDFFGQVPGVTLPHTTSIFFDSRCFLFDPRHTIPASY